MFDCGKWPVVGLFYRDRGDAVRALFLLMALFAYICLDFTMTVAYAQA